MNAFSVLGILESACVSQIHRVVFVNGRTAPPVAVVQLDIDEETVIGLSVLAFPTVVIVEVCVWRCCLASSGAATKAEPIEPLSPTHLFPQAFYT